jgi:ribosomal protein S18 acetylase RimI-like enzyme
MITIVPCTAIYWEFVRQLRTDARTRLGFVQQGEITRDEHFRFMTTYGNSYLIALEDGEPVGFAGSVEGDIRVCVDPGHQSHGIGKMLITDLKKRFPQAVARVKITNLPSQRLFQSCGYVRKYVIYEPL